MKTGGGVIFASFSRHAGHVRLELFGLPGRGNAHPTIDLDRGRTARVTCGSVGA
jgi:hypothetical protein